MSHNPPVDMARMSNTVSAMLLDIIAAALAVGALVGLIVFTTSLQRIVGGERVPMVRLWGALAACLVAGGLAFYLFWLAWDG